MELNYKKIGMFLLIAIGLFYTFASDKMFVMYTPKILSFMDYTMRLIVGGVCFAAAYYLYLNEYSKPELIFPSSLSYPPRYDSSMGSKSSF